MSSSRSENALKNISTALGGQLLNIVLNFVCRTIFIYTLGKSYLGVSGLFSNILTIMSLAELGIGDAIIYKLYKPVAEKNYAEARKYIAFYRKAYWIIGTVIFCIGLILIPFLGYLIKGGEGLEHIRLIYFLYLFNTASTYFFAYKKTIIIADQKGYIDTINRYAFLVLQNVVQIAVLLIWKNFILYLLVQIVVNFIANVNISIKSTKMYPSLKGNAEPLSREESKSIFKQTSALVLHKIGGVCVSGTDNLLISSFVGIATVGIYSNYVTILGIPQALLAYVFAPLTASVGNLIHTASKEHIHSTFNRMFLVNFWLYGFCAICLFVLANDFIGAVWLDQSFLLTIPNLFFIVLNFYLTGMRQTVSAFKSTSGLFWNDRFRPIAEAGVNLITSLVLLHYFGLIGVIIGTTVSAVTTTIWVEAKVVYKHVLNQSVLRFFARYFIYFLIVIAVGVLTYFTTDWLKVDGILTFILKTIICAVVINVSFVVLFFKTAEFKEIVNSYVKPLYKKVFKKR